MSHNSPLVCRHLHSYVENAAGLSGPERGRMSVLTVKQGQAADADQQAAEQLLHSPRDAFCSLLSDHNHSSNVEMHQHQAPCIAANPTQHEKFYVKGFSADITVACGRALCRVFTTTESLMGHDKTVIIRPLAERLRGTGETDNVYQLQPTL